MKRFWVFFGTLPALLVLLVGTFVLTDSTAAAPGLEDTALVQFSAPTDAPDPNVTYALMNNVRVNRGLSALLPHKDLGEVAYARAQDMAARKYYAHKNPDGIYYYDYFKELHINTGYSCENLDLVFVPQQDRVIDEWLSSMRGHKECMLSANVTHAGYATSQLTLVNFDGSETTAYLVVAIHAFIKQ